VRPLGYVSARQSQSFTLSCCGAIAKLQCPMSGVVACSSRAGICTSELRRHLTRFCVCCSLILGPICNLESDLTSPGLGRMDVFCCVYINLLTVVGAGRCCAPDCETGTADSWGWTGSENQCHTSCYMWSLGICEYLLCMG
jgi:hypothetical protein